jgi:hypothetical protein
MDRTLQRREPAARDAGGAVLGPGAPEAPKSLPRRRTMPLSAAALVAVGVSLALTATLTVIAYRLNRHNEHRLLDLQVKQTATVLQALLPSIETPISSAAEIAATSSGSAQSFRTYISAYVGSRQQPFATASLWRLDGDTAQLITTVGPATLLGGSAQVASRTLVAAAKNRALSVVGPLGTARPQPRLGYVYAAGQAARYVVYAESMLPAHRRAVIQPGSPFSDLRFALYVGRSPDAGKLLETNAGTLPVSGETAQVTVAFGSSALTLVAASTGQIGGGLSGSLWWIVLLGGLVLTGLAGFAVERLVRRRRAAEGLTERTKVLLAEQRSIAQTLQDALLPETLPSMPGLLVDARYVAGADDVDIGGDWYDLLPLDEHRAFLVIGDVSGRGLRAGTTMASLRFAIHALVSEGHPPGVVLDRLAGMIDVARGGQFATVLCALLDRANHDITVARAGHPPLLLITNDASHYIDAPIGPPIGVPDETPYRSLTVEVPPGAIVLAFTDGLYERPGETVDESLDRLRCSIGDASSLDQVFARILPGGGRVSDDDIAILGVQWLT